jgi:hypothetical protein
VLHLKTECGHAAHQLVEVIVGGAVRSTASPWQLLHEEGVIEPVNHHLRLRCLPIKRHFLRGSSAIHEGTHASACGTRGELSLRRGFIPPKG